MPNVNDAVRAFKKLLSKKQDTIEIRFALVGDGSSASTGDVSGRPGWAWVRYDDEPDKVSQVRNRRFPEIPQGIPVIIGKKFVTDKSVQVLGINEPLYDLFLDTGGYISYLLPKHGDSHHATLGSDPAYIDVRNILNGRARPTSPVSSTIHVEAFAYSYQGQRVFFAGGGIDLAGNFPGAANSHRYVLVSVDMIEERLRTVLGPVSPSTVPATPPGVPIWNHPIALALLADGETTVSESDLYEYRQIINPIGHHNTYKNLIEHINHIDDVLSQHLIGEI